MVATSLGHNKLYYLDEIGKETCYVGNGDESLLWHKRMGHIHFDNLVKISKKGGVKEIPEITKPTNSICKHYWHGKLLELWLMCCP